MRGVATIARNGRARFNAQDAEGVGITDRATILIDRDAKRIGIRAPRAGESPRIMKRTARSKSPDVWIGGAMLKIGIRASVNSGLHEVAIENGVLIIDFSGAE